MDTTDGSINQCETICSILGFHQLFVFLSVFDAFVPARCMNISNGSSLRIHIFLMFLNQVYYRQLSSFVRSL